MPASVSIPFHSPSSSPCLYDKCQLGACVCASGCALEVLWDLCLCGVSLELMDLTPTSRALSLDACSAWGVPRDEQLEERLHSLTLWFCLGTCVTPNLELLVQLPFQDMKLGQQTR